METISSPIRTQFKNKNMLRIIKKQKFLMRYFQALLHEKEYHTQIYPSGVKTKKKYKQKKKKVQSKDVAEHLYPAVEELVFKRN